MLFLNILAALFVLHVVTDAIEIQPTPVPAGVCISPISAKDCSDIREKGFNKTGVYRIQPNRYKKDVQVDVYCDFDTERGDWLVFQRRQDGSVNFERPYADYANGFGDVSKEFWLGNDLLHQITSQRRYKLRIDMEDFDKQTRFAEYTSILVGPASDRYRLTLGAYTGNAVDDGMDWANNQPFSALDVEPVNCVNLYRGGWWYQNSGSCHHANLNGRYLWGVHASYADGVQWFPWHGAYYSLKKTEMKISLQV